MQGSVRYTSAAFDRVLHKGFIFKLKSAVVSRLLLNWFADYLWQERKGCFVRYKFFLDFSIDMKQRSMHFL